MKYDYKTSLLEKITASLFLGLLVVSILLVFTIKELYLLITNKS